MRAFSGARDPSPDRARLRILATSDLHMALMPWDYVTDMPAPGIGLVQLASLIVRARAAAANCLLVDNGDLLQGNPLSDFLHERSASGMPLANPMIAAMNALGYDAGTLGNHEFNYGLDYLRGQLAEAEFPVVNANLSQALGATPEQDKLLLPASALLHRQITASDGSAQHATIGVIGFAPPQITEWDRLTLDGRVASRDILEAAAAHVPALRAQGAEIVIALAHSGIGNGLENAGRENAAAALARLPGIDALICGHTHGLFPDPGCSGTRLTPATDPAIDPVLGRLNGKPAAMPGVFGSHLARIDLGLERAPGGAWQVTGHRSALLAQLKAGRKPLPRRAEIARIAAPLHKLSRRHYGRPIGRSLRPITSWFALVGPDASLSLTADVLRSAAQPLIADLPEAGLPLIAAVFPPRAGGQNGPEYFIDIPAGPLTLRHAAEIYNFPDSVEIIAISGAAVAQWLERSVSIFNDLEPGRRDQPLIDPAMPAYLFDVLDGLTYEVDLTLPRRTDAEGLPRPGATGRVRDIRIAATGAPLAPEAEVLVAVSSYRYGGAAGYQMVRAGRSVARLTVPIQTALADYIRAHSPICPAPRPVWRLAPHPGTAAWFPSGPGGRAVLKSGAAPANIRALPGEDDGFAMFELSL